MKLNEKHNGKDATIDYKLITEDGQMVLSTMPASVAEEIAKRAGELSADGEEGFELRVNGEMLFPIDAFVFEDGELGAATAPEEAKEAGGEKKPAKPAKRG